MGQSAVAPLSLSEAGSWLCERHSVLRELCEEIGAWENGEPIVWRVRDAINDFDAFLHPQDTTNTFGRPVAEAHEFNTKSRRRLYLMSPSQVGRLRLLATLAPRGASPWSPAVSFCVEDLESFDAAGKELIEDWLRCVRIGVIG